MTYLARSLYISILLLTLRIECAHVTRSRVAGTAVQRYSSALLENDDINSLGETEGRSTEKERREKLENNYE